MAEAEPVLAQWRNDAAATAGERARAHLAAHDPDDVDDTVACLLVDHSGSLRGPPAVDVAAAVEVIADYWSRLGIRYEILGFTTVSWKGGRSRQKWRDAGMPPNPGRLCDLLHIVHRNAGDRGDGAPPSVRNLLRDDLLKENVDGEAVAWAVGRLRSRRERRKILVVVSDGAPVDDATLAVNPGDMLERHLRDVTAAIAEAGDVWLAGIGMFGPSPGYDMSRFYPRSVSVGTDDAPSQVVNFVADCTDVALAPGPRCGAAVADTGGGPGVSCAAGPSADLDAHRRAGRRDAPVRDPVTTVSTAFLAMVAAFLGLVVITVIVPELQPATTFPLVLVGWLISLCLHEYGHAVVAYGSGDNGVREKGYLTLDPRRYVNFQFSILWPLLVLLMGGVGLPGGAVYVNTRSLSPAQRSMVSGAGPLATLWVLLVLLVVLRGLGAEWTAVNEPLAFLAFLQVTALVFNLLPLPGLDGWGIIAPWLPPEVRAAGLKFGEAAVLLLFLSLFITPVNRVFYRLIFGICRMIGLDVPAVIDGLVLFQFWRAFTPH